MEKKTKINIWYIILAIWGVLLLQNLIFSQFRPKVIPYSEFVQAVIDDKVVEIEVGKDRITGKMKSDNSDEAILFTTVRVDADLSKKLTEHNVKFSGRVENTFLATLLSWTVPVLLFFGLWWFLIRRMQIGQAGMMQFGRNKAKVVGEKDIQTRFEDVAGAEEAKEELKEIVDFLEEPGDYIEIGGQMPKGVLLVGPPGTGKTLIARAVAGEAGVPFFSISGSEFVEMFVGLGAARVRDLFVQAKQKAPCIIFIDELDALGKARGFGNVGGHDEREQTLNQLLVEMDGFDPQLGVILMAATNRPEILDPALLRPGRFDRHILVDRPDKKGREEILKVHLKNITKVKHLDVEKIANMTPGMVGADLANLVNEAALLAVRRKKKKVGMAEFEEAVERVMAGLEKKNRLINPEERKIVAYHELGHAIVALSLPGTDPVQKISIIPRGIAALGYTMQVPTEDRFLMRKTELLNKIATLLGGRAAEEIFFSDISTGAHNDLSKATDIARSMVKEYGMSASVGQVYFSREKRPLFLEAGMQSGGEYSEATAQLIDTEIREIISAQYTKALEIIRGHQDSIEKAAVVLLEKEKIDGKELKALMGIPEEPAPQRESSEE